MVGAIVGGIICMAIIIVVIVCLCRYQESCCVDEIEVKGGHSEVVMV